MKKPLNFNKKFIGLSLLIFSVLVIPLIMFCIGIFENSDEIEIDLLENESILTQSQQDKVRKFGRLI
uniref:Putative effector n=1 Tax=Faba bean phyllody phytoplasma TaxID=33928 RepID=A0A1V0PKT2_9MOLU|nr:putative effector [Faba bean phyllody phytoplasma]